MRFEKHRSENSTFSFLSLSHFPTVPHRAIDDPQGSIASPHFSLSLASLLSLPSFLASFTNIFSTQQVHQRIVMIMKLLPLLLLPSLAFCGRHQISKFTFIFFCCCHRRHWLENGYNPLQSTTISPRSRGIA